jgi:protein-L-isoaspartate O-methyltransferase
VGSGYGTALAREVVGPKGLVVAIDLDAATLAFARANLHRPAIPTWSSLMATAASATPSTPL